MQKTLSKREIKELNEKIDWIGLEINKKDNIIYFKEDMEYYLWNNLISFFVYDNHILPSLKLVLKYNLDIPSVYVDKGAIPFVIKGADIMRPGIVNVDEFKDNSFVIVRDETAKKPIAIGLSILSSNELMNERNGKVIKNIHHFGDLLWKK